MQDTPRYRIMMAMHTGRSSNVRLGAERLLESGRLDGLRVGIVANPSSVDHDLHHIVDRLAAAERTQLGAVFGPQHGFRSDVQDNMVETPHGTDPTGLVPVYSLYSETREPTADMLKGLDLLVIDLQDVGARIYTYIYTMANCLRAAARHRIPVVVCDRPNPIGGAAIEGETLKSGFESFVGLFPIPMRHGLTIGELAKLFNDGFQIGASLEVIPMEGWHREMYFDQTDLPWVMPSPNIPTLDSAIAYPGSVLFEGTSVSEGRGTTRPFELLGLPTVPAEVFADKMNACELPGVRFRPVVFEPTFQKHAQQSCGGCQIHVTERRDFLPVLTGVTLLDAFRRRGGRAFGWRQPPYEYEREKLAIDILAGSDTLRRQIASGVPPDAIAGGWHDDEVAFAALRAPYLRYPS